MVIVVPLLLLPGCMGGTDEAPVDKAEVSLDGTGTVTGFMHLDECTGFAATQPYPPGLNPARPPPGWDVDETYPTAVAMLLWRCGRVGLDGLERPATLLWEWTTNVVEPQACRHGVTGYGIVAYLLNVVTDDRQIAETLRDGYGVPVYEAEFHFEQQAATLRVEWTTDGPSVLEVLDEASSATTTEPPDRWIWANGTGTGWVDPVRSYQEASLTPARAGFGQVGKPHVLGIDGRFAGPTIFHRDGELQGDLQVRGRDCA